MWEIILKAEFREITENSFKWEMIFFGQIFHLLLFFIWTHWLINCQSVGWLVGRFVGWSVGWSVGQLVGWLVGWPVSWLVILSIFILYLDSLTYQQLVSQSVGWLVGWSVGQSVGESVSWLVGWLVGCLVSWLVILFIFILYLVSLTYQLSVRWYVGRPVGWLVCRSVSWSISLLVVWLVGWLVSRSADWLMVILCVCSVQFLGHTIWVFVACTQINKILSVCWSVGRSIYQSVKSNIRFFVKISSITCIPASAYPNATNAVVYMASFWAAATMSCRMGIISVYFYYPPSHTRLICFFTN